MELYTLDVAFRRIEVIDKYESLIWTERMKAYGDFELHIHASIESRGLLKTGTRLALNESHRVMTVETVEDAVDEDGKAVLKVMGRSIEQILEERVARHSTTTNTSEGKWQFRDPDWLPADIPRHIFDMVCRPSPYNINPGDVIPYVTTGNIFPDDTIPEPPDTIEYDLDLMTVYAAVKQICDLYDLGFRLVRNYDTSQLHFNIYAGSDRTTLQTLLPAIIFTPELDNMKNTTELMTIAPNRNTAMVFSPTGMRIVYATGVDPEVEGFERRVLLVNASDINDPTPAIQNALMDQRGIEELSKNRSFSAFDGELNESSQYKYGIDYHLGDLVELRTPNATSNMRVTEQIFVDDAEGVRSYPTLAIDLVIEAGTWLAWDYQQVWVDLGLTEYWADQP